MAELGELRTGTSTTFETTFVARDNVNCDRIITSQLLISAACFETNSS